MKTHEFRELAQQFEDAFRKLTEQKRDLTFLLVGRTGVGKSSTINTLLGSEVAKTGRYCPTTVEVQKYKHTHDGVTFIIVDTQLHRGHLRLRHQHS